MISIASGNLLRAEVDALVNTVNTVGVMGKGLALQFKQAFPANTRAYEAACKGGEVQVGRMFVTQTGQFEPRLIINFPTKEHWKANSRLVDIESGLTDLIRVIREERVQSIAIPPLGCGFGGLRWEDVRPLIERVFESLPEVQVLLHAPDKAVAPDERW
ncbi:MAG: macro domain-containing protein [Verrucomicrobiales bacterium]